MPIMDGYTAIKIMMKRWPTIKVLALSQFHDVYAIGTMLTSGASGFISKEENIDCLNDALLSIRDNGYYFSKYAGKELFEAAKRVKMKMPEFTQTEKKLLSLFCTDMQ